MRLQSRGYVHSTSIDGHATYRNGHRGASSLSKGRAYLALRDCHPGAECRSEAPPPAQRILIKPRLRPTSDEVTLIRLLPTRADVGDPSRSV